MESEKVTVSEAAKMLGITASHLRVMMQQGKIDIGICYRDCSQGNTYRYIISREKLNKVLGK